MFSFPQSYKIKSIPRFAEIIYILVIFFTPITAWAHAGHGNEFQGGSEPTGTIKVDTETAQRLGIKVAPVKRQNLDVGIKTTGEIETLPSQKVEVTTPISGAKVVELLVEPGAKVTKGQAVAVLTSPDLVQLRVDSLEKRAQAQADLQKAQADLKLAQQNYQRYLQIAAAEIEEAETQVAFAQEKYEKDRGLAQQGAIPQRTALESKTQLSQAQAQLTQAKSQRDVIAAQADVKRSESAVEVAKTKLNLSGSTYQTRLQQLGNRGNAKGLVTVNAPISGIVADREVTLGQSFEDAGGKLMTIVNDSRVFATGNIYEKDLERVKIGQRVRVKVGSLPNRTFSGIVNRIGSVVSGESQVVPVQAEINNSGGGLKPGMFAALEVVTDKASESVLAIPSSAVVDINGQKSVYVQNGNAFQAVEVELGETSGDLVEVQGGLFEGDAVVIQRAPQLYAQSLRGGSKEEEHSHSHEMEGKGESFPWWFAVGGGGVIGVGGFVAGSFWSNRRQKRRVQQELNYEVHFEVENNHHRLESGVGKNSDL